MKPKNIAVGALAAVLVLALWYNFLLKPARSQATKVKADTQAQKAKLLPLQAQLDEANADAAHAGTFAAQLAALQRAVPLSPELATWIRGANGIAVDSDVAWQSVTHAPPTLGNDGVWSIGIGVVVKGTYPQEIDYLTRLSALSRLVVVDGVSFSAAASTGAGAGSAASGAGASTGPFSGASELTMTLSARMFETPPATDETGTETGTATAPSTGTPAATPAATGQTSTLNNS